MRVDSAACFAQAMRLWLDPLFDGVQLIGACKQDMTAVGGQPVQATDAD